MGFKTIIWIIIALILLITDHKSDFLYWPRLIVFTSLSPITYSAGFPARTIYWLHENLAIRQKLLSENESLHAKQLLLETQIQQLNILVQENSELKTLLNAAEETYKKDKVLVSQILTISNDPLEQKILIDNGKDDGVFVGQVVVDAHGVVGQVTEVEQFTSHVMLITDTHSAVPVQNGRNSIRAIAIGDGYSGELSLLYVSNIDDFKEGDALITSGLDQKYPMGYTVGTVKSVSHLVGQKFAEIKVTPSSQLNKIRKVLLIWPAQKNINNKYKSNAKIHH